MIVIYGIKQQLDPIKTQLSLVIAESMQQALGFPLEKRAHRFMPMDSSDFIYPSGRSDAYTVIEINLMQGRTEHSKKALIKTLFANIQAQLGIEPIDIEIIIKEQPPHCWGFRGICGDEVQDLAYKINV